MSRTTLEAVRSKLRASVQRRGVAATIWEIPRLLVMRRWWALQELWFDLTHGVRTRGHVTHDDRIGEDPAYAHARRYQGIGAGAFRELMATLEIEEGTYAFVDIGSGRGRALILAAEYPFQSIVGVELSPELTQDAERNLQRLRRRHASLPPIEVACADATTYPLPSQPLVVFLYNPFDATLMAEFIRHLGASLEASRQPAFVIYSTPVHREVTDAAPFLELHREGEYGIVYRSRD